MLLETTNEVQKEVLTKIDVDAPGSIQYVGSSTLNGNGILGVYDLDDSPRGDVLPDCGERNLVIYHINRMIRDLYINSNNGGKSGAYRKQCRIKRKSAMIGIATRSEHILGFRWSARALGFDPDILRNRILFDVHSVTSLLCDGVKISRNEGHLGVSREAVQKAEVWLWEEAPERYRLSERKLQYIIKMDREAAENWLVSLEDSPLQFEVETFHLTSGYTILILKHR